MGKSLEAQHSQSTVSSGKALKVTDEVSRKREWTFYFETLCYEIFNLANFSNFAFSLLTDRPNSSSLRTGMSHPKLWIYSPPFPQIEWHRGHSPQAEKHLSWCFSTVALWMLQAG